MAFEPISHVTINLLTLPAFGSVQVISRMREDDRTKIVAAADALGMKQSEFTRLALIRVAEAVLTGKGAV